MEDRSRGRRKGWVGCVRCGQVDEVMRWSGRSRQLRRRMLATPPRAIRGLFHTCVLQVPTGGVLSVGAGVDGGAVWMCSS